VVDRVTTDKTRNSVSALFGFPFANRAVPCGPA